MFALPALADAPPGGISAQTLPEWWGSAGRPGYVPDAALAGGMPWTLAGLTAGSWQLRDPLAPAMLPTPGVAEAQAPMAWYDSAAVTVGEDAAWSGYGAGIATAQGFVRPPSGRKPRAMLALVTGTNGVDHNAIFINRGSASSWLRGGATGDERGPVGDLGLAGNHLWTVASGITRGRSAFDAGFAQRGMFENLRSLFSEGGRGVSGHAGWNAHFGRDSLALRVARGFDSRETFVGPYVYSDRRDAQENNADLQWWRRRSDGLYALRFSARDARVVSVKDTLAQPPGRQEWSTRSAWVSARALRNLGGGALDLQLGAGHDRATGTSSIVPAASWRVRQGDASVRLFVERALVPVWSDLEPGQGAFLQNTWLGGFETGAGSAEKATATVLLAAGRTGSRATEFRYPIRGFSQWLGWERDLEVYRFLLLQGGVSARWGVLASDASGYALARPLDSRQPRVDPGVGGRAGLECRFRMFAGDLGVRLRVEGAYVGARETDTRTAPVFGAPNYPDVLLPGFGTFALGATFTVGDATIAVRGEGLGGERHPESWIDPSQTGDFPLARDSGPTWRTALTWPLFN